MSPDDLIKVGDKVSIYWDNIQNVIDCEVLSMPNAFGEPWVLRDFYGVIHYVMVYSRITRRKRSENMPERQKIS